MRNLTAADLSRLTQTEDGTPVRALYIDTLSARIRGEYPSPTLNNPNFHQLISWRLTGQHQLRPGLSLDLTPLQ